jgi:allantoinase
VGHSADLVVFAPDATFVVDPARLEHRNQVSAYAADRLQGVIRQTWLRGELVRPATDRRGQLLDRPYR